MALPADFADRLPRQIETARRWLMNAVLMIAIALIAAQAVIGFLTPDEPVSISRSQP